MQNFGMSMLWFWACYILVTLVGILHGLSAVDYTDIYCYLFRSGSWVSFVLGKDISGGTYA